MTDRPIKGWTVQATCPNCAGILAHIADGQPNGLASRAIARCTGTCGRTYAIQITITDASHILGRTAKHPPDCGCARCANGRKTHCVNGHPYGPDDVRADGRGRQCRICNRASAARAKQKKAA